MKILKSILNIGSVSGLMTKTAVIFVADVLFETVKNTVKSVSDLLKTEPYTEYTYKENECEVDKKIILPKSLDNYNSSLIKTNWDDLKTSYWEDRKDVKQWYNCLKDYRVESLLHQYDVPCENAFETLLACYPYKLQELINLNVLEPYDLTFALEIFGKYSDDAAVVSTLMPFLDHSDSVVREGALYGLQNHLNNKILIKIKKMSTTDTSEVIKNICKAIIDSNKKSVKHSNKKSIKQTYMVGKPTRFGIVPVVKEMPKTVKKKVKK